MACSPPRSVCIPAAERTAGDHDLAASAGERPPRSMPVPTAYADAYQFFDTLFDVRATPSRGSWDFANYCKAIENLKGIFSISDSDFGHYHKAYHVHCESKKVYDSSSYAALVHEVYSTHAGMSKTETRTAEALAALSFIIAVAGVVVGSIALHKVRKTGATAFKNSYVVHNV